MPRPPTPETEPETRPITLSADEVRAVLTGGKVQVRRPVKAPNRTALAGGKPCGKMFYDLSRAWADHGFPTDDDGVTLPMSRWGKNSEDPAPESAYRYHYLHLPFAHPNDGFEEGLATRLYWPFGEPGDRLWVKETFVTGHATDDSGDLVTEDAAGNELPETVWYRATESDDFLWLDEDGYMAHRVPWKSPALMPRALSRLTVEVESVRVEPSPWTWVIELRRVD